MKKILVVLLVLLLVMPVLAIAEGQPTPDPKIDLTPIFQALIALLAAVITVKVVPWIKCRTTNEQQAGLLATVRTLVFAAEQIYGAGRGDAKLAWVEESLQAQGYKLDTKLIKAAIEAQVQELTVVQGKSNQ